MHPAGFSSGSPASNDNNNVLQQQYPPRQKTYSESGYAQNYVYTNEQTATRPFYNYSPGAQQHQDGTTVTAEYVKQPVHNFSPVGNFYSKKISTYLPHHSQTVPSFGYNKQIAEYHSSSSMIPVHQKYPPSPYTPSRSPFQAVPPSSFSIEHASSSPEEQNFKIHKPTVFKPTPGMPMNMKSHSLFSPPPAVAPHALSSSVLGKRPRSNEQHPGASFQSAVLHDNNSSSQASSSSPIEDVEERDAKRLKENHQSANPTTQVISQSPQEVARSSSTSPTSAAIGAATTSTSLSKCSTCFGATSIRMAIVQGFINPPAEKVPGGKDNRRPILPQVISIDTRTIPEAYQKKLTNLAVKVSLMGFKRLSVAREEVELSVMGQLSLEKGVKRRNIITTNYVPTEYEQDHNMIVLTFDNLIVNFSSHNHGQKLFIRFQLVDTQTPNEEPLCSVDSAEFETITKRGIEKQIRKMKKQDSSPSASTPAPAAPSPSPKSPTTMAKPSASPSKISNPSSPTSPHTPSARSHAPPTSFINPAGAAYSYPHQAPPGYYPQQQHFEAPASEFFKPKTVAAFPQPAQTAESVMLPPIRTMSSYEEQQNFQSQNFPKVAKVIQLQGTNEGKEEPVKQEEVKTEGKKTDEDAIMALLSLKKSKM